MSFFNRVQVQKYNPNHAKDGKFSTTNEAGGPKSIDDTPDGTHKNMAAFNGIIAHIKQGVGDAEFATHEAGIREAVGAAMAFNTDMNSKTKAMFIMNALKEKFAGWGTPSKKIRAFLQTKVSYKNGNKAFDAIHDVLKSNETGKAAVAHAVPGEHAATAPPVSAETHAAIPEVAKPAEHAAPAHIPDVVITPIVDEPKPARAAAPVAVAAPAPVAADNTPAGKLKAAVAGHVFPMIGLTPEGIDHVTDKVHDAYLSSPHAEAFETKMNGYVSDLENQGKIGQGASSDLHGSNWKGLYGKLNGDLTSYNPLEDPAPAPAPAANPLTGLTADQTALHAKLWNALNTHTFNMSADTRNALGAAIPGFLTDGSPKVSILNGISAKLQADPLFEHDGVFTHPVRAALKEALGMSPDIKPAPAEPAKSTGPVPTGDHVHDNTMGVMHYSGKPFTDLEKVVGANSAKNAMTTADDAAQFKRHVADGLSSYDKQFPGKIDAEKLKALPWEIVHDESKKAMGKVPANPVYTTAETVKQSFPGTQSTAAPAAPVVDPKVNAPTNKLAHMSGAALDEEVHNQMNQAGYQGQGGEAHALITASAKKAFLEGGHANWGTFDHKFISNIEAAKGKQGAKAVAGTIDSVKLHDAIKNGEVQTKLDDTTAKKPTVPYDASAFKNTAVGEDAYNAPAAPKPDPAIAVPSPYVSNATALSPGATALPSGYKPSPYQIETALNAGHKLGMYDAQKLYPALHDAVSKNLMAMGISPGTKGHKILMQAMMKNAPKQVYGSDYKKKVLATIGKKFSDSMKQTIASEGMWANYGAMADKDLSDLKKAKAGFNAEPAPSTTSTVSAHTTANLPPAVAPKPASTGTAEDAIAAGLKDAVDKEILKPGIGATSGSAYHHGLTAAILKHGPSSMSGDELKDKVTNDPNTFHGVISDAGKLDWGALHKGGLDAALNYGDNKAVPAKSPNAGFAATLGLTPSGSSFKPTAAHYQATVTEKAKAAGINPYAVQQMADTANKVGPTSTDAADFKAKAHADLDAKVAAGTLKPSPSVDKLKNFDWEGAHKEAQADPADKIKAAAAAQAAADAQAAAEKAKAAAGSVGDTSEKGDYAGFKRYDNDHAGLAAVMNQRKLTSGESTALGSYKESGYQSINAQLRGGKMLSANVAQHVANLLKATTSGTIPKGTVLFRGMPDYQEIGFAQDLKAAVKEGKAWHDNGFLSVSTDRSFADSWGSGGAKSVLFEMKITHDVPGVHVGAARNSPSGDGEQEIVMPPQTLWKVTGVRPGKGSKKTVVTLETM